MACPCLVLAAQLPPCPFLSACSCGPGVVLALLLLPAALLLSPALSSVSVPWVPFWPVLWRRGPPLSCRSYLLRRPSGAKQWAVAFVKPVTSSRSPSCMCRAATTARGARRPRPCRRSKRTPCRRHGSSPPLPPRMPTPSCRGAGGTHMYKPNVRNPGLACLSQPSVLAVSGRQVHPLAPSICPCACQRHCCKKMGSCRAVAWWEGAFRVLTCMVYVLHASCAILSCPVLLRPAAPAPACRPWDGQGDRRHPGALAKRDGLRGPDPPVLGRLCRRDGPR